MDDSTATAIMQRFGKAYFKKDRALLSDVLCEDFLPSTSQSVVCS